MCVSVDICVLWKNLKIRNVCGNEKSKLLEIFSRKRKQTEIITGRAISNLMLEKSPPAGLFITPPIGTPLPPNQCDVRIGLP